MFTKQRSTTASHLSNPEISTPLDSSSSSNPSISTTTQQEWKGFLSVAVESHRTTLTDKVNEPRKKSNWGLDFAKKKLLTKHFNSKKRLMVLSGSVISFYKTKKEISPSNVYPLSINSLVMTNPSPNQFSLKVDSTTTLHFTTNTSEEAKNWIDNLNELIKNRNEALSGISEKNIWEIDLSKITLCDVRLGFGSSATVEKGVWQGVDVAAKFFYPGVDTKSFKRELFILSVIRHPNIVVFIGAQTIDPDRPCLVTEFVPHGSLDKVLHDRTNPVSENMILTRRLIVKFASDISKGMSYLHEFSFRDVPHTIIHRDLKTGNLLVASVDPETAITLKITDFGISREVLTTMTNKQGTPIYMAPEMLTCNDYNHKVDVYSFGMILWEMVTHTIPWAELKTSFQIEQKVLGGLRPKIPVYAQEFAPLIVSCWDQDPTKRPEFTQIIENLERLKSSFVIQGTIDQELDMEDFDTSCPQTQFTPSQASKAALNFKNTLYGREKELEMLEDTFKNLQKKTKDAKSVDVQNVIVLVSGFSGVGKTALINNLNEKQIIPSKAWLATGKFEQFKQDLPFTGFIQAFNGLINKILSGDAALVAGWKKKLLGIFGAHAKTMIDAVPSLEKILGKVSSAPKQLAPEEIQRRVLTLMCNMIALFQKLSPMVIFLDDLQWADPSSLLLINHLCTMSEKGKTFRLMLILAFRDNEVTESHRFKLTMKQIESDSSSTRIENVHLMPLRIDSLNEMILDVLDQKNNPDLCKPLTDLVFQKTGGNPFFVIQFLKALNQEKLLTYSLDSKKWSWDFRKIQDMDFESDVLEFMIKKIKKLSTITQDLLTKAAHIGNKFSLDVLGSLLNKDTSSLRDILTEPLNEALISPCRDESEDLFKFNHDRIQQATYCLITSNQVRESLHLKIGYLLLSKGEEHLYDVTNHLNLGRAQIKDEKKIRQLIDINIQAAIKYKHFANKTALEFLKVARDLVQQIISNPWESDFDLTYKIHSNLAEIEYYDSKIDESIALCQILSDKARTETQIVDAANRMVLCLNQQGKLFDGLSYGLETLKRLGLEVPEKPDEKDIDAKYVSLFKRLPKPISEFLDMPITEDVRTKAILRMISTISDSAWFANRPCQYLIHYHALDLILKNGVAKEECCAIFSQIGISLLDRRQYSLTYDIGKLAEDFEKKFNIVAPTTPYIFSMMIYFLRNPYRECTKKGRASIDKLREAGWISYMCYSVLWIVFYGFMQGDNIQALLSELPTWLDLVKKNSHFTGVMQLKSLEACMTFLAGSIKTDPKHYEETDATINRDYTFIPFVCAQHYLIKAYAYYLVGDYQIALETLDKVAKLEAWLSSLPSVNEFWYIEVLILSAIFSDASEEKQKEYTTRIEKDIRELKEISLVSTMNYRHKYFLIKAEYYRAKKGPSEKIIRNYLKANAVALDNMYYQDSAIAQELLGRFFLERFGAELAGKAYLVEARKLYRQWGARALVEKLDQTFPEFFKDADAQSGNSPAGPAVPSAPQDAKTRTN